MPGSYFQLSRRERQIMDVLYRDGSATAARVREAVSDPPSYSAVRAKLRVLEDKGHVTHMADGPRYVFRPTIPRHRARQSALHQLVRTFFDGSAAQAAAALLDMPPSGMTSDELDRLSRAIDLARNEGR